jgi:predicted nucleotidyltransferase
MSHQQNIARIKAVYNALEELASQVVFVGGATVSLYANRPAVETRATDDIDILIEVAGYPNYALIEEKLRLKGFSNDIHSKVICRYTVQGIIVDVMPTDKTILGFANRWYQQGFTQSMVYQLDEAYPIRIFTPAYFIATKLEAFNGRGQNDGRTSTDFEDIVYVLNNRTTIWDEMAQADHTVREYLTAQFSGLVKIPYIEEWISAQLDYQEQRRLPYLMGGLNTFIEPS